MARSTSTPDWDVGPNSGSSGMEILKRNGRKRKSTYSQVGMGMDVEPSPRIFISNNVGCKPGQLLYDAVRKNDNFLLLLMSAMSNSELRRIAIVSSDWCDTSYQVIRSRIGNRPFVLLWMVSQDGLPLTWRNHFHPSFLKSWNGNEKMVVKYMRDSTYFGQMKVRHQFSDVRSIIVFGNQRMEDAYVTAIEENDIPNVDVFVCVTAPIIFFTAPDLGHVGDSDVGLYHRSLFRNETFSQTLASLCIPKSVHVSVDFKTLLSSGMDTLCFYQVQNQVRNLKTKVIIIFKCYADEDLNKVLQLELNKSFSEGALAISVISVECLFVSSNHAENSQSGGFLCVAGDNYMSSIVLEISDVRIDALDSKFKLLNGFITNGITNINNNCHHQFAHFALFFSYNKLQTINVKYGTDNERMFLQKFRQLFPSVPIQGIGSDKPISSDLKISPKCDEATQLALRLSRMQCSSDEGFVVDNKVMVVLVVKYVV